MGTTAFTTSTYTLTAHTCDEIAEQITAFCDRLKVDVKDTLRYRISAEECLLFWLENGCEGKKIHLRMGYHMLSPFISLEAEGEPLDPYRGKDEDFGTYSNTILSNLHLAPEYSFDGVYNRLFFRVHKKRRGQIANLALVICAAILVGVTGLILLPETLRTVLLDSIIVPIYDTFYHVLSCLAGPMIFLAVTWGIYGIGDTTTLGRVGKRLIMRYLALSFIVPACCSICFPLFNLHLDRASGSENQLSDISELILGIFPSTIIEPFATGNTLQIIFMAIIIGVALLFLGQKTSAVALAIEQINYLVQFLMELISRLVPFVVFLVVINLIWSGNVRVLDNIWVLLSVFIGSSILIGTAFLLSVSIKYRVRPITILRKSAGTFLIALATASSAAAFANNMTVSEKKFGIKSSLCSFGIPLGMVMHKPMAGTYFLLAVFYLASYYKVPCSITWLALSVIVCTIVAVATPPIPGGGVIAYTILFSQMGIPAEAMAVAITLDMLTDFVITAFEMFCMPLSLIHTAYRLNMIDTETLRTP